MSKEFIENIIERYEIEKVYVITGYDNCVIGFDFSNTKFIYCENKILLELCKEMEYDDALDFYYYNIIDLGVNEVIICSTLGNEID
jgi:hypothetical protein